MYVEIAPDAWAWDAWRLFERVGGVCGSELEAISAIEHFLEAPHTYTLQPKAGAYA